MELLGSGLLIPSPPILAGRANSLRSSSLGGGLPVSVERRTEHKTWSSGVSRRPIPGMVLNGKGRLRESTHSESR